MKKIFEKIRETRMRKGISIRRLSEMTGISKSALSKYELEQVDDLPLDKVKKIASALNVDPLWLAGFDKKGEKKQQISDMIDKLPEDKIDEVINFIKFLVIQEESK